MVAVVKRLLVLLIPLVVLPLVFAQSISVQIVGKMDTASLDYIRERGLLLTVNLYYSGNLNYVAGGMGYLKVYVIYGDGKLVYQDVVSVSVSNFTTMQYYIPGNVFSEEGRYTIRFIYQVPIIDGRLLEARDEFALVVSNVIGKALILLRVYPDLTQNKTFYFDRSLINFIVEVYNPLDYSQYVSVKVNLLDQQGNLVLSQSQLGFVLPGQRGLITIPVNFLTIQPGKYVLILSVFRGSFEELRLEREVIIGEDQYLPVYVYSITQYPYVVKPGDFVEFKILIKNRGEPIQVKIIANSTTLNLYKETGTIDLDSREVKEIKLVIRVPEDVSGGRYPIQFTLQRGLARYQYTYYLEVKAVEKAVEEVVPIKVEFIEPTKLVVGNYSEAKLVVWSNIEELRTYTIRIDARGAEVEYNNTFTIGGVSERVELPIKIKPLSEKVLLNIKIYDESGNVVYESKEELIASKVIDLRYYISLAFLIAVILIVIVLLVYLLKEGRKKRKVEEAE